MTLFLGKKVESFTENGGYFMATNYNVEHREGKVARTIEQQTAKLPSDLFLWAALGSMAVSAALQFTNQKKISLFVGQWAPSFLLLGLYNKLVKLEGHEGSDSV